MGLNPKSLQQRRNLYDKNIKILSENYPEVVDKINNTKNTNSYIIKPTGKRNLPNIFINELDKYYYKKNDPIEDVKKHIFSLKLKKTNIAIFLGFGLGYEVLFYGNALSEKLETKQVLIIEKDIEMFKQVLEWIDLSVILKNERVKFIINVDEYHIGEVIKKYLSNEEKLNCLEAVSTIYYPSAFLLNKSYYLKAINIFNQVGINLLEQGINNKNVVFEKNIKALKEYYPNLAEQVMVSRETGNYKLVKTGDEQIYNLWIEDKKTFYYDFENPILDSEQQIEELKLKNTRLALVLGCGLGYELEVFKNKVAIEQNTLGVIIVEKEMEIFKLALQVTDLTEYICKSKIKIIVGIEEESFFSEFQNFFEKNNDVLWLIKTLKPVYHNFALILNKDYYLKAIRCIKNSSSYMLNFYGNDPEDSMIGVNNILKNLNEIIENPGINLLYNKFKGKPAVVVSTGPSLNKNKHLLKGLEDEVVIIAADSALKILNEIDVKPHFVTMLERGENMSKLIEGFSYSEVKDTYFAACPVVDPKSYEVYPGPRVIVYRNFDHFKWIGLDRGILDIKQSAGNMSFKIAESLGCDPIILIGQDLSYSRDGHTHAKGMVFGHERKEEKTKESIEVMGNDGEKINTHKTWYEFLKSYEVDISKYKGTCINSTEGGAYIRGTKVMTFKEAIDKFIKEKFYPLNIIRENALISYIDKEKEIKDVLKIIDDTLIFLENLLTSCQKGMNFLDEINFELEDYLQNNRILNEHEIERINVIEKEVMTIKRELEKDRKTFQLFFMHIVQPYVIKFEMDMVAIPDYYENISFAKARIAFEQRRYFDVISGIAKKCIDMLVVAQKNLI